MSVVAIFIIGAILFFLTTWSSVAFGVSRMHELQSRDIESSDAMTIVEKTEFTELHVSQPTPPATDQPPS